MKAVIFISCIVKTSVCICCSNSNVRSEFLYWKWSFCWCDLFPNIQHLCDVGKYFGYMDHMGKFVVI